jgi:hypothetical protein
VASDSSARVGFGRRCERRDGHAPQRRTAARPTPRQLEPPQLGEVTVSVNGRHIRWTKPRWSASSPTSSPPPACPLALGRGERREWSSCATPPSPGTRTRPSCGPPSTWPESSASPPWPKELLMEVEPSCETSGPILFCTEQSRSVPRLEPVEASGHHLWPDGRGER